MNSSRDRFVVIGARGFIGASICRLLVEEGVEVMALDASPDPRSVSSVLSDEQMSKMKFLVGDARDSKQIAEVIGDRATHVIDLAGLLRPASENNPYLSTQVSVGGLINVLDAAVSRKGGLKIAYASTAAVYGPGSMYAGSRIVADSQRAPTSHYGIHRYMMELTAERYFEQHGIASIGLRPWVVYGAGRFNGLTAQPSLAMLAAAANAPFEMAYGGRSVVHHVRDVALAFIRGVRCDLKSAVAANVPGESVAMGDLVEMIAQIAPESRGKIKVVGSPSESPQEVDDPTLERLIGPLPSPTLERVKETITDYRRLLAEGRITFP